MNSSTLSITHLHTQDTMDVVTSGFLRRLSPQSSPPRHYTLRQYGLLECPALSFSLSILDTSVAHDQDKRAIRLVRANHAPPIVLQPRSPKQLEQWLAGMRKVKAPPLYYISFSYSNLGDTGVIMRGVSVEDGSMVVVKVIPRVRYPIQSLVETTLCSFLSCTQPDASWHLVRCLHVFNAPTETHSVMEVCGPALEVWLQRYGFLSEVVVQSVIFQLSRALDFLHGRGIIHGGVAMRNVMVRTSLQSGRLEVRLGGFSSAWFRDIETAQWHPRRSMDDIRHGKMGVYVAPEVFSGEIGSQMDYWSLGVLCYRLVVGRLPFAGYDDSDMDSERRVLGFSKLTDYQQRKRTLFSEDDEYCSSVSEESKDFVLQLLAPRAQERMNAARLSAHPWMKDASRPVQSYFRVCSREGCGANID